jgi:tetratricopeptide (TPR) repeat protein
MAFDGQRWEQAMDYYNKAVSFYPLGKAPVGVYFRVGATLQALGQWDKSRPYFDKVVALKPETLMLQRALQRRSATFFALQYGAFREGPKAAELANQVRNTVGIPTIINTELRENTVLFLVRSGNYKTFEEANFARQRMLPKYPLVAIVP